MPHRHGMPLRLDGSAGAWLNTHVLTAQDFRGLPTLLHFFSNDCDSCEQQLFRVHEWISYLYGRGMQFVGVFVPIGRGEDEDSLPAAAEMVRRFDLNHPVLADGRLLARIYRLERVPAYLVFDARGRLTHAASGKECLAFVEAALQHVLSDYERSEPVVTPTGAPFY